VREWGRDEVELVRRCREGSEAAYAVLVRLHRPRLFALAYRLTGDRSTAEDVVQEAFLAAFKAIDRFEPKPSLAAWLNKITVRIAGRAATRQAGRPKSSLDQMADPPEGQTPLSGTLIDLDPTADPQMAVETGELRRALGDAIERLPFKYRAAVVLRYVIGLEYAEAAVALDVPLNTFKSHLLRGTRMLREELANHLESAPGAGKASPNGEEATDDVAHAAGTPERAARS
jgi:RNA polymerase sigma-70 factor (ECF subfamily)